MILILVAMFLPVTCFANWPLILRIIIILIIVGPRPLAPRVVIITTVLGSLGPWVFIARTIRAGPAPGVENLAGEPPVFDFVDEVKVVWVSRVVLVPLIDEAVAFGLLPTFIGLCQGASGGQKAEDSQSG